MKTKKQFSALVLALTIIITTVAAPIVKASSQYTLQSITKVYGNAYDAKSRINSIGTYQPGTYNVFKEYDGMLNISKSNEAGAWINPNDNAPENPVETKPDSNTKVYRTDLANAYIRNQPSSDYTLLGVTDIGDTFEGILEGNWIKTTYKGNTAYLWANHFYDTKEPTSPVGTYTAKYDDAYIRSNPDTNYRLYGTTKANDVFQGVKFGNWIRVTYQGRIGYLWASHFTETKVDKPVENKETRYTTSDLFIRSQADSDSPSLGIIDEGEKVEGIREGAWFKFIYDGKQAYIAYTFTSETSPGPSTKITGWSWDYPSEYGLKVLSENNGFNRIGNKVYLTFDNGYEYNNLTSDILDILKEKNIKTVFFLTGSYMNNNPELTKRIIDEGHIIGNHTRDHLSIYNVGSDGVIEDIKNWEDVYLKYFNQLPDKKYYRPASGEFSEKTIAAANDMGYTSLLWRLAYVDWDTSNQPTDEFALNHLKKNTKPGDIVLLHSVSETNVRILGQYIDWLRANGYSIGSF